MIDWLVAPSLLLILLLMSAGMIYPDYRRARKKEKPILPNSYIKPSDLKVFRPHLAALIPTAGGLVITVIVAIIILSDSQPKESRFWGLISSFAVFVFLFLYFLIRTVKAYLKVDEHSIVYQGVFFRYVIDKTTIENIYDGDMAIYVKRKSKRFPLIIDKMFCNDKMISNTLKSLIADNIDELTNEG